MTIILRMFYSHINTRHKVVCVLGWSLVLRINLTSYKTNLIFILGKYVTDHSCSSPEMDWRFRFKPWTDFHEINSFGCKLPTMENSRSVWGPLRPSKPWAWTEHPPTVKLVWVFQLGVSDWNPRLWHFWECNAFSRKCQWATHLNVR